ncbi:MAG: hypothetical protein D6729_16680 [Deltaproteobacteria bacterium]|nr:MAG: hypothetical protein D6729_16680 [Deltaproteobacteria bacterium]
MALRLEAHTGYLELVTDFFTERTGRGLLLAPAEVALVESWQARGIPVEVVCRAIAVAADAYEAAHPGARAPKRLGYYAGSVEDAFRAAREKAVGARRPADAAGGEEGAR